jgi:flagellar biosynthesis chaperone FliJ
MAVSQGLRRVLEIRRIQEEQSEAALNAALGHLRRLETALKLSLDRERGGRRLVAASIGTGDMEDRLAGLAETHAGERRAALLKPRIADAEDAVNERRAEFLERRMERQQAETLIEQQEARDALDATRLAQRDNDDWYLGRLLRSRLRRNEGESASPSAEPSPTQKPVEKLE